MEKICGFYTKRAIFAWNTAVMASNPLCSFKVTCEMCSYGTVLNYYFPLNTTIGVSESQAPRCHGYWVAMPCYLSHVL
jgi:hypothetical protein